MVFRLPEISEILAKNLDRLTIDVSTSCYKTPSLGALQIVRGLREPTIKHFRALKEPPAVSTHQQKDI